MRGIHFRIDYDTPKEVKALAVYPLLQDSNKAYPHFDVTSGFIVVINPHEEDLEKEGVIIPCVKKGRWYFKGGNDHGVAWHESEDDASQPHTGGVYTVSGHDKYYRPVNDTFLESEKKYPEMIDVYTKQKCLIYQIIEKGNLPSHLCGYITQFIVFHPDDKRYFTSGCTDDGWYAHTDSTSFFITDYHCRSECGIFDAKKFRDYSKLPVEKLMNVMKFESRFKGKVARDLWYETVRNTADDEHPVSLPNGMFLRYNEGTASIGVRYNRNEECVAVRLFVQLFVAEDSDDEADYDSVVGSDVCSWSSSCAEHAVRVYACMFG